MKLIKYFARWLNYLAIQTVLCIFRLFFVLGIFKETSISFLAGFDLGRGGREYDRQNYGNALKLFHKYEHGDNDYCHGLIKYNLALMYFYGRGVQMDSVRAEALFMQSAALGNGDAIKYLTDKSHDENEH